MSEIAAPPAACNPLLVPEILGLVLSFVAGDRAVLASAARVNTLWFDHATLLLWDDAPWEALVGLERRRRLHDYAPRIRRLACRRRPSQAGTGRPSAADLDAEAARGRLVQQLFSAGTRDVVLRVLLTDSLLQHLGARCANLRRLHISSRHGALRPETLGDVLARRLGSLESIAILSLPPSVPPSDLLVRLAEKPSLRRVRVRIMFTSEKLRRIRALVPAPFRNLQALHARVASSAVPLLVECLPNVTALHLHVVGGSAEVLPHVARLTALRSLEADFYGRKSFTAAEVMSLQRLRGLTTLRLCDARNRGRHRKPGADLDLSPRDFEHLLARIGSRLVHLEFGLPCVVVNALSMVARHCPVLMELRMRHSPCRLPSLEDGRGQRVLFPELRFLIVRSLGGDRELESINTQHVSDSVHRLRVLMPRLYFFFVTDRTNPDKAIMDAYYNGGRPTSFLFVSQDYALPNGCPRDGCVGYSQSTCFYTEEEEASEDYDNNQYNSHGNDDTD